VIEPERQGRRPVDLSAAVVDGSHIRALAVSERRDRPGKQARSSTAISRARIAAARAPLLGRSG